MSKFDGVQKESCVSTEPQLTSFSGVVDVNRIRLTGCKRDEIALILAKLNEDAARYYLLASLLGTINDSEKLRRKLRTMRARMGEHITQAHSKLIPVLKGRSERTDELERLYRAFCACLEFLGDQYYTTLLIEVEFVTQSEGTIFIRGGLSEKPLPRKHSDKLALSKLPGTDILSVKSFGSSDTMSCTKDDLLNLQREIAELKDLIYSMNQALAIQTWEIDPDMETEKFSITLGKVIQPEAGVKTDNGDSVTDGRTEDISANVSEHGDSNNARCVSIVIVVIMVAMVGGIVAILVGVLD